MQEIDLQRAIIVGDSVGRTGPIFEVRSMVKIPRDATVLQLGGRALVLGARLSTEGVETIKETSLDLNRSCWCWPDFLSHPGDDPSLVRKIEPLNVITEDGRIFKEYGSRWGSVESHVAIRLSHKEPVNFEAVWGSINNPQ